MAIQTGSIDLKAAKDAHDEASKKATNYLSADESGIMVYDGTNGTKLPSNPGSSTNNVFIDSNSLDIRKGETVLATFGSDGAQIGQDESSHMILDDTALILKDVNGIKFVEFKDMVGPNGMCIATDIFKGDGITKNFTLSFEAQSTINNYHVYVNDTEVTSGITKATTYVGFETAPRNNVTIKVEYGTISEYAKSYTLGFRKSGSVRGGLSVAEGLDTEASGNFSHAEGNKSKASGKYSHAEGYGSAASGRYSHAEGEYTEAIGECSHAEGSYTNANGRYSHAEGFLTSANGLASHASGEGTTANGDHQTVIGHDNAPDTTSALIIGNGYTESTDAGVVTVQRNALTIDWDGNVDIYRGHIYAGGDIRGLSVSDLLGNRLADKVDTSSLATVATSGSYSDLSNKPTNVSAFTNDVGYITDYTETDPTVPSWAKASTKPSYTANEIGGLIDFFNPTVDFLAGGNGIAFGQSASEEGFHCDMPTYFKQNVYIKTHKVPVIYMATTTPTSSDGEDGDVWLVYS